MAMGKTLANAVNPATNQPAAAPNGASKFCTSCGSSIQRTAKFCSECGVAQSAER